MGRFDEVEVLETFTGSWVGGFEIADREHERDGFLIRRQTDGVVLPDPIPADRVRPAHSAPPA